MSSTNRVRKIFRMRNNKKGRYSGLFNKTAFDVGEVRDCRHHPHLKDDVRSDQTQNSGKLPKPSWPTLMRLSSSFLFILSYRGLLKHSCSVGFFDFVLCALQSPYCIRPFLTWIFQFSSPCPSKYLRVSEQPTIYINRSQNSNIHGWTLKMN